MVQWEEARRSRQAAARQAAQAAAAQLQADAAELQQSCRLLESWLAAKKQASVLQDSQAELLTGQGDSQRLHAWTDCSLCLAVSIMMEESDMER